MTCRIRVRESEKITTRDEDGEEMMMSRTDESPLTIRDSDNNSEGKGLRILFREEMSENPAARYETAK